MEKKYRINIDYNIELEEKDNYFSIPAIIVAAGNRLFRGGSSAVYYIGKLSYYYEIKELSCGFLYDPSSNNVQSILSEHNTILNDQCRLRNLLEDNKTIALSHIHANEPHKIYSYREGNNSIMYVSCTDGIIGAGWNGKEPIGGSKKDILVAAFLLYAFGQLNREKDPNLYVSTDNYLPWEAGLDNPEIYDQLICKTLKDI